MQFHGVGEHELGKSYSAQMTKREDARVQMALFHGAAGNTKFDINWLVNHR
jgi:hypothetical protein